MQTLLPKFFDDHFDEDLRKVYRILWIIVIVPTLFFLIKVTLIIAGMLLPCLNSKKMSSGEVGKEEFAKEINRISMLDDTVLG